MLLSQAPGQSCSRSCRRTYLFFGPCALCKRVCPPVFIYFIAYVYISSRISFYVSYVSGYHKLGEDGEGARHQAAFLSPGPLALSGGQHQC